MRRTTAFLAAGTLAACSPSQSSTSDPAPVSPSHIISVENFPAKHVLDRNLSIYLPPGYAESDRHYPVIYAQDGQNLFEPGFSYAGDAWEVDAAMDRLIGEGRIEPAIVVGIWNSPQRRWDYAPQSIVEALPAPERALVFETTDATPLADAYTDFIVLELKPYIDATFRTRPDATSTSLMGSSMGGLISLYTLSRHPDDFGQVAALSTHWPIRVSGTLVGDEAARWQDMLIPYWRTFIRQAPFDPSRHRIWMDHGSINLDALYAPYQEAIDPVMQVHGFVENEQFVSRVYPGADHNEAAWQARIDEVLIFLLGEEG
ncbi:alpha/beta hydrolase-fold protein [Maricaulis sp.]|uniref:alpha/beta hydrolase n=1 Tax=Maricaulis sp. TaxID=1486257 RepID=UPI001B07C39B|nr:alpha/beta hydrolase-fold protein [Maricaulis sp.]MBO6796209.1 esterase family protein [Maricaulis sp.]